jgi:hypothetical protein
MTGRRPGFLVLLVAAVKLVAAPPEPIQKPVKLLGLGENVDREFAKLTDIGITPSLTYYGVFQGNPVGGIQQRTAYSQLILVGVELNFEKLVGLPGGSLTISGAQAMGENLSSYIGNINTVSEAFSTPDTVLFYQLYWKQLLFGDKLELRLGRMTAADQFASVPAIALMSFAGARIIKADEPPAKDKLSSQDTVFRELIENASALLATHFGKSEPAASDLASISSYAKYFESFAAGSDPVHYRIIFSDKYLYGFAVDNWQLQQIAKAIQEKSERNFKEWAQQISDVRNDVVTKVSSARWKFEHESENWGIRTFGPSIAIIHGVSIDQTVTVTAATLDKDGKEIPNYEVWFCLKALIKYKDRYDHFDRLSSPTDRAMVPGNYIFWAKKGLNEGAKIVITGIGDDGHDRTIDLPTP